MALEHYKKFLPIGEYKYLKKGEKDEWVRNWEFIDSIDWTAYIPINKEIKVYNFIESLEESNVIDIPEEQGGCILNWISEEEFAEFINKKYGYKYQIIDKSNYYILDYDAYILREGD